MPVELAWQNNTTTPVSLSWQCYLAMPVLLAYQRIWSHCSRCHDITRLSRPLQVVCQCCFATPERGPKVQILKISFWKGLFLKLKIKRSKKYNKNSTNRSIVAHGPYWVVGLGNELEVEAHEGTNAARHLSHPPLSLRCRPWTGWTTQVKVKREHHVVALHDPPVKGRARGF